MNIHLADAAFSAFLSSHAVVCLTEGLFKEFRRMGARLSASVVCPGLSKTAILDAKRNRPMEFGPATDVEKLRPERREWAERFARAPRSGFDPAEVARQVFEAIREDRCYVFPAQADVLAQVHLRLDDILHGCNPTRRRAAGPRARCSAGAARVGATPTSALPPGTSVRLSARPARGAYAAWAPPGAADPAMPASSLASSTHGLAS